MRFESGPIGAQNVQIRVRNETDGSAKLANTLFSDAAYDGEICGGSGSTIDGVAVMEVCCGIIGRFVTIQLTDSVSVPAPLEVSEILVTATNDGCADPDEYTKAGNCAISTAAVGTYDDSLNDGSCPTYAFSDNTSGRILMFRQDITGGQYFANAADATNKNSGDPTAKLYSVLDTLSTHQKADGSYHLQMCFPDIDPAVGDGILK